MSERIIDSNSTRAFAMGEYLKEEFKDWLKGDQKAGLNLSKRLVQGNFYQDYKIVLDYGEDMLADLDGLKLLVDVLSGSIKIVEKSRIITSMKKTDFPNFDVFSKR